MATQYQACSCSLFPHRVQSVGVLQSLGPHLSTDIGNSEGSCKGRRSAGKCVSNCRVSHLWFIRAVWGYRPPSYALHLTTLNIRSTCEHKYQF